MSPARRYQTEGTLLALLWAAAAPALAACVDTREFDCAAIAATYATSCSDQLSINSDTSNCNLVHDRQGPTHLEASIDRAARICESAGTDCDRIFVCVADADGLSAVTASAHVSGTATVKGQRYAFDASGAWAWLGTKGSGVAGDLGVLFEHEGHPWNFKLDDFAVRAKTNPFVVDTLRPIKLEGVVANMKLTTGTVLVAAFAVGGVFDITATAADDGSGHAIDLRIQGDFRTP